MTSPKVAAQGCDFADILKALRGIDLPQGKAGLLIRAEDNNAGPEILALLQALPEQQYSSLAAVIGRAVGQINVAADAEQIRTRGTISRPDAWYDQTSHKKGQTP